MDVEPFIKNASPFFQSFIERSLSQIDAENEGKPSTGKALLKSQLTCNLLITKN